MASMPIFRPTKCCCCCCCRVHRLYLLNVAGINSEIIFKSLNINLPRVPRRIFLKNISQQLFQDHLKIRSQLKNLPRSIHDLIILYCKKAESPESQNLRSENGAMFAQVPKVVCHKLFATNAGDTYVNVILRIFAKIANNIRLQLLISLQRFENRFKTKSRLQKINRNWKWKKNPKGKCFKNAFKGVSVHPKALLKEMGRHDITFTADNSKDHYGGRKFRVHHDRSSDHSWDLPFGPRQSSFRQRRTLACQRVVFQVVEEGSSLSFSVILHILSQQLTFPKCIRLETKVLVHSSDNCHRAYVHFLGYGPHALLRVSINLLLDIFDKFFASYPVRSTRKGGQARKLEKTRIKDTHPHKRFTLISEINDNIKVLPQTM
ncbi:hypothetical protein LAZ67_3004674 [Cordylochernes scorpioides]|uniref:Uncharacterized protein n=1 Tax=Cordylochernes scorpioides TaxID=51811 RepID=A0ABY6K9R3_9ARAC|nr:hypothetical protein LAZ67_3004674 [Cordylochernes scorpioides]